MKNSIKILFNKIKYHSCVIIPIITSLLISIFNKIFGILSYFKSDKIDVLISIAGAFIGILIMVLTIYISLPRDSENMKKIKKSGHHHIFVSNIMAGIILYMICIIFWIFCEDNKYALFAFLLGFSNTVISSWYIYRLTEFF